MARKRFSAAERQVIETAGIGGGIEWQNVTQWHLGIVRGPVTRDASGWESVAVESRSSAGITRKGERVCAAPGHVRAMP